MRRNPHEDTGHEGWRKQFSLYVGIAAVTALITPAPMEFFMRSEVLHPNYLALVFWFMAAAAGVVASIQLCRKGRAFWQRIVGGLLCAIHLGSLLILWMVHSRA